jgi:hypothetical protein
MRLSRSHLSRAAALVAVLVALTGFMAIATMPTAAALECPADLPVPPEICGPASPTPTATATPTATPTTSPPTITPAPALPTEPSTTPPTFPSEPLATLPPLETGGTTTGVEQPLQAPVVVSATSDVQPQLSPQQTGGTTKWVGGNVPLLALGLLAILLFNITAKPTTVTLVTHDRKNSDD